MAKAGSIRIKLNEPPRQATSPVLAQELGQQLCAVFGLSADRTRRISIDLEAGMVASVTVDQFITRGQADALAEVATTYGLHRAEPVRQLSPGFTVRDRR